MTPAVARLFVAVFPPPEILDHIRPILTRWRGIAGLKRVRWVPPEQVHLTLRFLGNVAQSQIPAVSAALDHAASEVPPFSLRLDRPGCFPTARAVRILWLGLVGDLEAMQRLHQTVVQATGAWGEAGEHERFHPHLTLGRCREPRPLPLQLFSEDGRGDAVSGAPVWKVGALSLMQSVLRSEGPTYSLVSEHRLGDRPSQALPL
jgi:2'-5' RNA ligase